VSRTSDGDRSFGLRRVKTGTLFEGYLLQLKVVQGYCAYSLATQERKMGLSHLTASSDLTDLQNYVSQMKVARGFSDNKDHAMINLTHQIGSLSKQIKFTWGSNGATDVQQTAIGQEIADVLIFLVDIANQHRISIAEALIKREQINSARNWITYNLV
jgi:hypothetical protein